MKTNKTLEKLNDYEAFVEKFKPKKTTDDSYTPEYIIYNHCNGCAAMPTLRAGRLSVRSGRRRL